MDARSPLCTVPCLLPGTTINVPQDWQCSWLVQRSTSFLVSHWQPGRCFFFTFAFVFGSVTGRCCVQTCVVALSVSVFSFGVYTPLEVISDISLTIMLYCYTPYSVSCSVLLCVRRILYSVLSTELSMDLVKWPTYWKQTTLPITQV